MTKIELNTFSPNLQSKRRNSYHQFAMNTNIKFQEKRTNNANSIWFNVVLKLNKESSQRYSKDCNILIDARTSSFIREKGYWVSSILRLQYFDQRKAQTCCTLIPSLPLGGNTRKCQIMDKTLTKYGTTYMIILFSNKFYSNYI